MAWTAVTAGAVAGAAGWFSHGVLDVFSAGGTIVRVALLPSVWQLAVLAWLGVLSAALVTRHFGRRQEYGAAGFESVLLPAFALGLIALPYLPYVADAFPVLRVLAGPARGIIWTIVAIQVGWAAWLWLKNRPSSDTAPPRNSVAPVAMAFLAGLLVFRGASLPLTETGLVPSGDEPHYLVIAESLWRDGDLRIENNHPGGDDGESASDRLEAHSVARGRDGGIYSALPIGLPMLLAPVYGWSGYDGVVWMLMSIAAAAAAVMYRRARELTTPGGAAAAWCAVCLGAPYALNSVTVYPYGAAALAVVVAFGATREAPRSSAGAALRAIPVAALPWLGSHYAVMAIVLVAIQALRLRRTARAIRLAGISIATVALSFGLWAVFFYFTWGSPFPTIAYGGGSRIEVSSLVSGAPGLLMDQEYGIFVYAPALALAISGLAGMWRTGGEVRRLALETAAVCAALLFIVGSTQLWSNGSVAPGGPLASIVPLLGLPIAWHWSARGADWGRRALHVTAIAVGATILLVLLFAQSGLLIVNDRDGSSRLLDWLSPDWHLWALFPSFVHHPPAVAWGFVAAWVVGAVLVHGVLLFLGRRGVATPGGAALRCSVAAVALLALLSATIPVVFRTALQPARDINARASAPALDRFDAVLLPHGVIYDPFRVTDADRAVRKVAFVVTRGIRRDAQPLRLLMNARFALPAGSYRAELDGGAGDGSIGVQIGREGPPLVQVPHAVLRAGEPLLLRFDIPVDTNFVGFRGDEAIERAVTRLRLTAARVVDAHRRAPNRDVFGAASTPAGQLYVHDHNAWPEGRGVWTRARSIADLSLVCHGSRAVVLRLHSGPVRNDVTLAAPSWQQSVSLAAGVQHDVRIPLDPLAPVLPLRVATNTGFRPSQHTPGSNDDRLLGVWITVLRREN